MEKIIEEKRREKKARLIGKIMDVWIENEPNRSENWYGETFNQLYDKTFSQLSSLLNIVTEIKQK